MFLLDKLQSVMRITHFSYSDDHRQRASTDSSTGPLKSLTADTARAMKQAETLSKDIVICVVGYINF